MPCRLPAAGTLLLALACTLAPGCAAPDDDPLAASRNGDAPGEGRVAPSAAAGAADASAPGPMSAVGVALLPVDAGLEAQGRLPMDPFAEGVHPVPTMAARIREGYRIGRNTPELAPDFTGNALSCFNCHLNGGQKEGALPLVGAAATFPQYRSRNDALVTLEERIAGCFRRSMNGTAPPRNHPVALALSAYITWISRGQPLGERPAFAGRNAIPEARRLAIEELDLKRGRERFRLLCAGCHGMDGQGVALPQGMPGPLWGPGSWNDGAGAGRIWKLAGFIRHAMPLNQPGIVDDADAQHISAWINSHPRPEFATKAADWPGGGRPADAVYDTLVFPRHPLMERRERGEAQPERPLAPAPRR